jgi:hypothetical protein
MIVCLVLSVSCVSKEVPVTETYYETEYQQEPYTTTESYEQVISHKGDNLLSESDWTSTYILLNEVSDRSIKWAIVTVEDQYPIVHSLAIQSSGKNHRISVSSLESGSKKLLSVTVQNGRSSEGIKLGFKPKPLPPFNYTTEMIYNCQRAFPFMSINDCEEAIKSNITGGAAQQFGFAGIGETVYNVGSVDFLFDDLFNTRGWALISITNIGPYSVDYVWDEVQVETKEVTKYRDIPVQVEKQRTVTETKKVPFWEAVFSK